ncbi:MAG TPA: family 43 glycosylhydrolase [Pyrinomonadaceae bacterium]|nr:family 43 glycosylhydrolase [Pyrinomonadaceae bacterium]
MRNSQFVIRKPRATLSALALALCALSAAAQERPAYTNPAIAGDYPDPSVIRVGRDYWATTTSSDWAPLFPLLHSRDLVNWRIAGAVFQRRPEWSVGNYWASEIAEDRRRFFIFYTARRREGPLCVAVATAPRPSGPYTDRGPLVCQEAGSIDAFPIRDERGRLYLVWKEDGNSRNLPTPLWAQRLSEDGTRLLGERRELIRNDAAWEAQLVEGPYILRRGGWFYMFYSGNACCGRECNYALGVARARRLLGPWEKNPANPILKGNETWKCPGHGTIVRDPRGRHFLLYHAYHPKDSVYVGRQALLDEVLWGADGWPTINGGRGPSKTAPSPHGVTERDEEYTFFDEFTASQLIPGWQWPQSNEPTKRIERAQAGRLHLSPTSAHAGDVIGAIAARSTTTGDYVATTMIDTREMKTGARAGLSAYGNVENALGLAVGDGRLFLWRRERNQHQVVTTADAPVAPYLYVRMTARDGHRFRFATSPDGRVWTDLGEELDGAYLPPWDLGIRVALTSGGVEGAVGKFEWLRIEPSRPS